MFKNFKRITHKSVADKKLIGKQKFYFVIYFNLHKRKKRLHMKIDQS